MGLLRRLVGFGGVLKGLPRIFVPGLMIFLFVVRSGDSVCVRCEIVKLRCSLV